MGSALFTNWSGTAVSTPKVVAVPRDLDELKEVLSNHDRYPSPVRAAGSFHSLTACFESTGTQILMKYFDKIEVDLASQTITVGAVVSMVKMRDALRPHGMQTEVTPEIGNATAGSVACGGTKDASIQNGLGQVASTVVAVKMVNPVGEVESITADEDPDRLFEIRSSYGLLGVIFEVTFRIQPAVTLAYDYRNFPLDPPPTRAELLGGADGMLSFAQPYANRIIVERRFVIGNDEVVPSRFSRFKRRVRDKTWESGVSTLPTLLHSTGSTTRRITALRTSCRYCAGWVGTEAAAPTRRSTSSSSGAHFSTSASGPSRRARGRSSHQCIGDSVKTSAARRGSGRHFPRRSTGWRRTGTRSCHPRQTRTSSLWTRLTRGRTIRFGMS